MHKILLAIWYTICLGVIALAMLLADEAYSKEYKQIIVAVIDDGYDTKYVSKLNLCKEKSAQTLLPQSGTQDSSGHGTNVGSLIVHEAGQSSGYCLRYYKVYDRGIKNLRDYKGNSQIGNAVTQAVADGAHIINISMSGVGGLRQEYAAIGKALFKGVVIFVAAGNDDQDLSKKCNIFPACYNLPIIVVGNGRVLSTEKVGNTGMYKHTILKHVSSNYGSRINVWLEGCKIAGANGTLCGTSQSTALATGQFVRLLLNKQTEPKPSKGRK